METKFREIFEQNLLDGDDINDSKGTMLSATDVFDTLSYILPDYKTEELFSTKDRS